MRNVLVVCSYVSYLERARISKVLQTNLVRIQLMWVYVLIPNYMHAVTCTCTDTTVFGVGICTTLFYDVPFKYSEFKLIFGLYVYKKRFSGEINVRKWLYCMSIFI